MKKTSAAIFCALSLLLAGNAAWADALDEKSRSIVAISAYTARGDMDKLDASLVHCRKRSGMMLTRSLPTARSLSWKSIAPVSASTST